MATLKVALISSTPLTPGPPGRLNDYTLTYNTYADIGAPPKRLLKEVTQTPDNRRDASLDIQGARSVTFLLRHGETGSYLFRSGMFEVPQDIASDPDADLGTARAIALIASLGFDEIVQSIPFPMVISLNSAGDQNGDRAEITSMSLSAKGKTMIAEGTVVVHSFGKHDATFRLEFSVAPADVWGGQSPDGAFLSIRETKFDLAFKHPVVWFLGGIVLAFVRSKITARARDTLETQLHTTVMDRLYPGQNLKPRDVPVMVLAVEEGAQSDALELTLSVIKHPLLAGGEPQLC